MNRVMKLLMTLSIALIAVAASAQPRGGERGREGKEVSVEKIAEAISTKMTKELELSDKQKQDVYNLMLESVKKHDQQRKKESQEMSESRKTFNAEMEKILTKEQYAKWEQMRKERKEHGKKHNEIKQKRGE